MERIKSFDDLIVFQRAYKASLEIHQFSLLMPKVEQYGGIADQIRRASKGICANMAEGYGKQHVSKQEFKRYLSIATGSANEVYLWLKYCVDLMYISTEQWRYYQNEYLEIAKMLTRLQQNWS